MQCQNHTWQNVTTSNTVRKCPQLFVTSCVNRCKHKKTHKLTDCTVGWATARASSNHPASNNTGCWFVGDDILIGALHVLQLQLSPLTTSITLSSNKIQNGDTSVPANPGPPGKTDRKRWAPVAVEKPKTFRPPQTPFPGAQDGQNLISWRWSLTLPTNPVC